MSVVRHNQSSKHLGNMDLDSSPTDSEGLRLVLHFCFGSDQEALVKFREELSPVCLREGKVSSPNLTFGHPKALS